MVRKILLLLLCLLIMPVYAETREEKMEKVTLFAKNFVLKSKEQVHIDKMGSVLWYVESAGTARIEPYNEVAGTHKYCFDSAGFVAFVLKKTINLRLVSSDFLGGNPYYFHHFLSDNKNFDDVTDRTGVAQNELKQMKDKLQIGDLIIVSDYKGISFYSGNDEIVEASSATRTGFDVSTLDNFLDRIKSSKIVIKRLKDSVLPEKVNTTLRWLDTKKEEDFLSNDKPLINISSYNSDYVKDLLLKINIRDYDGLQALNIEKNNKIDKNIILNKDIKYDLEYDIDSNGKYKISVKDSLGNETIKELNISNIDNKKPVINKLYYNDDYIIIEAVDNESGLHNEAYSFDNCITWISDNKIRIEKQTKYNICVRDKVGNISKDEIIINNGINKIFIIIPLVILLIIIVILILKKNNKRVKED